MQRGRGFLKGRGLRPKSVKQAGNFLKRQEGMWSISLLGPAPICVPRLQTPGSLDLDVGSYGLRATKGRMS